MPLPLPDLDTRHWADLVEEARALLPRFAPGWTDHNVHDPGIMLVELLAWLTEQDVYRANRVPARHRRKFLQLLGYHLRPPEPACAYLSCRIDATASPLELPAGTVFSTEPAERTVRFRTTDSLTVCPLSVLTLQSFDGAVFADLTSNLRDHMPLLVWGRNPEAVGLPEHDPALYLGFDRPVPVDTPVRIWVDVDYPPAERDRLSETNRDRHHGVRIGWEFWDGTGWRLLDAEQNQVTDDTRGLSLPGAVTFALPAATAERVLGAAQPAAHYLRCRLTNGRPDQAPQLLDLTVNAVRAEQVTAVRATLRVDPIVEVPAPGPEPRRLLVTVDSDDTVTAVAEHPGSDVPPVLVLARTPESVTLTLALLGHGSGNPGQRVRLPETLVVGGSLRLWTSDNGVARIWRQRADLDASTRTDADFMLDTVTSDVVFGDGECGEVVPPGAAIFARYDATLAGSGNVAAGCRWRVAGADDEINRVLLGIDPALLAVEITNRSPASGGAAEETADHAAGRAAQTLWAHERIAELGPPDGTLDQLDHVEVLSRPAPERATTLLDFERLALEVPGTAVTRARAWSGVDPRYPGVAAPGTVTVVVVPSLPVGEPRPTAGLLATVRRHLDERRVICTRVMVTGPEYLRVTAGARIAVRTGADPAQIRQDVITALNRFLDPVVGGPSGRGWPFGRDIYRTEVLRTIAVVPGVDHVRALILRTDDQEAQCGNLCVPTMWLVAPGAHEIETE